MFEMLKGPVTKRPMRSAWGDILYWRLSGNLSLVRRQFYALCSHASGLVKNYFREGTTVLTTIPVDLPHGGPQLSALFRHVNELFKTISGRGQVHWRLPVDLPHGGHQLPALFSQVNELLKTISGREQLYLRLPVDVPIGDTSFLPSLVKLMNY